MTLLRLFHATDAGVVLYDSNGIYPVGSVGHFLKELGNGIPMSTISSINALGSNQAALTVTKAPTDGANPNIVALFRNTSDSQNYDGEVHIRLQAGTNLSHRAYINFANYDGVDKWVTGRNAESCWILYNSETIHRLWMDPGAAGPHESFRTGNTYLNSAETGKIRLNWHPSDHTGTGGLEVWSGGNNGSGVTTNVNLVSVYCEEEPFGITGSTAGNVLTITDTPKVVTVGMMLTISGIPNGVYISSQGTGVGGPGTYNLSQNVPALASQHMVLSRGATVQINGSKDAGNGTGSFIVFGGAYIQRGLRVGGALTAGPSSVFSTNLLVDGPAGSNREIYLTTTGVGRWVIQANASAESVADAGTNFYLLARNDAGGAIDAPLSIVRAAGGTIALGGETNRLVNVVGTAGLRVDGKVGFNSAVPQGKLDVTGSRGGNAALASAISKLAMFGLFNDLTTA